MQKVLITGANKGIGFATARHLLEKGYFVYLGCRNAALGAAAFSRLQEQGLVHCEVLEIDVTDQSSVDRAVAALAEKAGVLDVLINNAGILGAFPAPGGAAGVENAQQVFNTNYFGVIRVTTAMLPLLQRAEQPRIVNVSSETASLSLHQDPSWAYYPMKDTAYVPSKTALNFYTMALAYQLKDTSFKVTSVCPGYTATDMNNFAGSGKAGDAAATIAKYVIPGTDTPSGKFYNAAGELPW
ncbi:SDR family NAD(P)-dependent oxidoreductase [Chitinophaga japonensis]|uniref:Short-subunit dehydrogenase n=1 Tax=Chitinophaga japonensis TaxID=104662 RepID=A0A562T640_CHIJA|nr:SDR family NAD(P)-dependent oxidoreductase [Chitinophaga japonensis]TWI89007.1 short-subunit dehydrogenase [Chitinophaga japonensis]